MPRIDLQLAQVAPVVQERVQQVAVNAPVSVEMPPQVAATGTDNYIMRSYEGITIPQKPDGYINATKMCQCFPKKKFADFWRNQSTQEFVTALSLDMGIPTSKLVVTVQGRGDAVEQGTWVHPDLAIKLAGWINPHFEIQVIRWARAVMEGRSPINTHTDIQHRDQALALVEGRLDLICDRLNTVEAKVDTVIDGTAKITSWAQEADRKAETRHEEALAAPAARQQPRTPRGCMSF